MARNIMRNIKKIIIGFSQKFVKDRWMEGWTDQ